MTDETSNIATGGYSGDALGVATGGLWQDYLIDRPEASKRQMIVNAVGRRLNTILAAAGYKTDLGSSIFLWRPMPFEEAELPAANYRDVAGSPEPDGPIGQFRWGLDIDIQIVASGSSSPQSMRDLIQDVYRAIGTDTRWGGLAVYTGQPSDEITVDQQDKFFTGAALKLRIIYDSPLWEL